MNHRHYPSRPVRAPAPVPPKNQVGRVATLIVLAVACAGGMAYYDMDKKRADRIDAETEFNDLRASLTRTRSKAETLQGDIKQLQGRTTDLAALEEQKGALVSQIPSLERAAAGARAELAEAVAEMRIKAVGMTRAEMRLTTGQLLSDARILSVSDADISVAHAGGLVRISGQNLPRDLQDLFRFGMLPESAPAPASPAPAQAGNAPPATGPPPPQVSAEAPRQRLATLKNYLVTVRAQIAALERQASEEQQKYNREMVRKNKTAVSESQQTMNEMLRAENRRNAEQQARAAMVNLREREVGRLRNKLFEIESEMRRIAEGGAP